MANNSQQAHGQLNTTPAGWPTVRPEMLPIAGTQADSSDTTASDLDRSRAEEAVQDLQIIKRGCQLIMFRDMEIHEPVLQSLICPELPSNHYKYGRILIEAKKAQGYLQRRM